MFPIDQDLYGVPSWRDQSQQALLRLPKRSPEVQAYFDGLWPACEPFVSRPTSVFLADLLGLVAQFPEERWIIRDGLLPLIWFFTQNPEPKSFRGLLLIDADFEPYIPNAWREKTGLYELFSDGHDSEKPPSSVRELVLMGLIMPSVCSLSRLKSDLDQIIQALGGPEKNKELRIKAVLPARYEMTDPLMGHCFYNRFMATLLQGLGTEIEFIEPHAYQWQYQMGETWYHEFNEKFLYAISYLKGLALMKGHWPLNASERKSPSKKYDEVIPLFPQVSCGIRATFTQEFVDYLASHWVRDTQANAKALYRAMGSSASRTYPWPVWFPAWCKDISTGAEGR